MDVRHAALSVLVTSEKPLRKGTLIDRFGNQPRGSVSAQFGVSWTSMYGPLGHVRLEILTCLLPNAISVRIHCGG